MQGLHILAELHRCACERTLLHEVKPLRALCLEACASAGLTIVAEAFHAFGTATEPSGATGAVVLAESHLAVHTWPEIDAVTLDLYVCNFSRDNTDCAEACFAVLRDAFCPTTVTRRDITRGAID